MQRSTHQRRVIRRVLMQADRPLSPGELFEAARELAPGIGHATIYRNLKSLREEGWVEVVDLPSQPSRYEVAGKGHHHPRRLALRGNRCSLYRLSPRRAIGVPPGFDL